jgi:guanine deaminase
MDSPTFCPNYYRDASPEASLASTQATVSHIQSLDPTGETVAPIITPRFAPACSRPALKQHSALAASHTPPLHIQTHISENQSEIALVNDVFPDCDGYADVYDSFGLLTPRTILAHAVHLTEAEKDVLRARGAKVSHCPTSNSALGSGLCPVRELVEAGLTVGLGTDVSGGYSPSILEQVRQACLVSRLLKHVPDRQVGGGRENVSVEEGLFLATRGGAAVLDMDREIGGFEVGMRFDAQLVGLGGLEEEDEGPVVGNVDVFGWESWTEKIHKWVWCGDDRNVRRVWVNGRLVHGQAGV